MEEQQRRQCANDTRLVAWLNSADTNNCRNYFHKGPNKLINATGAGVPSLIFVCPQYAITYFDGCQVTVGAGASAGTRCIGIPVSVAHCHKSERLDRG